MTQTITTMHAAFLHELGDAYDAERQLTKALPALLKKAKHAQVKQRLTEHLAETEQQLKNLEEIFQLLGTPVPKVACQGMAGLVADTTATLAEIKAKALIDAAIVGGCGKVEHYEIATYRGLLATAHRLGHTRVTHLLEQNLQQEVQMAQQLEALEQHLGQDMIAQGPKLIGHELTDSLSTH
jgi:ferritin-like metal-binding protein YciE